MMGHRPNHIARLFDHVQNGQPGGIATGQLQGPSGGALGARGKIGGCQDVAERIGIREFLGLRGLTRFVQPVPGGLDVIALEIAHLAVYEGLDHHRHPTLPAAPTMAIRSKAPWCAIPNLKSSFAASRSQPLKTSNSSEKDDRLLQTLDRVAERFGKGKLQIGTLLKSGKN